MNDVTRKFCISLTAQNEATLVGGEVTIDQVYTVELADSSSAAYRELEATAIQSVMSCFIALSQPIDLTSHDCRRPKSLWHRFSPFVIAVHSMSITLNHISFF